MPVAFADIKDPDATARREHRKDHVFDKNRFPGARVRGDNGVVVAVAVGK